MPLLIPAMLYDELSTKYCHGDEKILYLYDVGLVSGSYKVRALRADHPEIGFGGAVGYYENGQFSCLVLWHRMPTPADNDHYSSPDPLFIIKANVVDAGVWAYSRGNLLEEKVWAEIPGCHGLNLGTPSIAFAALILARANKLAMPNAQKPIQYWEAEKQI